MFALRFKTSLPPIPPWLTGAELARAERYYAEETAKRTKEFRQEKIVAMFVLAAFCIPLISIVFVLSANWVMR